MDPKITPTIPKDEKPCFCLLNNCLNTNIDIMAIGMVTKLPKMIEKNGPVKIL